MKQSNAQSVVEVTADQLPISCPLPDTPLWNSHPLVFIPLDDSPVAKCNYCGTVFKLVEARSPSSPGPQSGEGKVT